MKNRNPFVKIQEPGTVVIDNIDALPHIRSYLCGKGLSIDEAVVVSSGMCPSRPDMIIFRDISGKSTELAAGKVTEKEARILIGLRTQPIVPVPSRKEGN